MALRQKQLAVISSLLTALGLQFGMVQIAQAHDDEEKTHYPTVDLSTDAEQIAPNDQASATAYIDMIAEQPAEVARKVNAVLAQAIALSKQYATVKVKNGSTATNPQYDSKGRKITGWQMHSELLLESKDIPALAELIGKLQTSMAVSQLTLQAATDTRKKAAEQAQEAAIEAFKDKAKRIAKQLGSSYRVVHLNVSSGNQVRGYPMVMAMRAKVAEDAAPMPVEAGDTTVTINVSGQIEILP